MGVMDGILHDNFLGQSQLAVIEKSRSLTTYIAGS